MDGTPSRRSGVPYLGAAAQTIQSPNYYVDGYDTHRIRLRRNAGRSQMATAFAERERDRRGLDDVEIVTGGTDPGDRVSEFFDRIEASNE